MSPYTLIPALPTRPHPRAVERPLPSVMPALNTRWWRIPVSVAAAATGPSAHVHDPLTAALTGRRWVGCPDSDCNVTVLNPSARRSTR